MIPTRHLRVPRPAIIAICAAGVVAVSFALSAAPGDVIRIWVVGSPYTDRIPDAPSAAGLREASRQLGFDLSIEAFPTRGFAATFADAVVRSATPDVLVFDNFGVMDGITTRLGRFDGIGQDPTIRAQLIKVTGAFDELLGPARGWTYLFASSRNHAAARTLALRTSNCPSTSTVVTVQGELGRIMLSITAAYLKGDTIGVQADSDPDRLPVQLARSVLNVGALQTCGIWGNDKLTIAIVSAAYEAVDSIGNAQVLLVFRKPASRWQSSVATRDPISTREFVKDAPRLAARLARAGQSGAPPIPATLLLPSTGQFPRPPNGNGFGTFTWQSSPSGDVVGEIVEFAYYDDERLFFARAAQPAARGEISAGRLWHTQREWLWRLWSISRTGDIGFSESRTFVH
jgi:hypothetical protein